MKVGKCGDNPRISWHAVERVMQRCELPGGTKVRSFLRKAWKEGTTASWQFAMNHCYWDGMPKKRKKSLRRKHKNSHYKVFGDLLIVSRDNTLITVWRLSPRQELEFNLKTLEHALLELRVWHRRPNCDASGEAFAFKYFPWLIRMTDRGFFDEEELVNESR